ncbi:MAG TPA: leucine-rich repeat domain-containing protein [Chitinophagales bacterium]|nr:leucine-rich repeat domain-containing protein [Chitinophagales bacterium]
MAKLTNQSPNNNTKPTTYYIDATNVCYWRNPESPSLVVLLKLLVVLKREKKQDFFCIFDANTAHKLPQDEIDIYTYMLNNGNFHQVSGGKRADDYLLSLADMYDGSVISNDNYSDPKYSRYRWKDRDHRPTRLFMGEVIKTNDGEHLMLFDLDINVKLDQSVSDLFKQLDTLLNPPKEYYTGTVRFYNAQRGWGRISFLKESYLPFTKPANAAAQPAIEEGMEVSFKIVDNAKGEFADELTFTPLAPKVYKGVVASYDEMREAGFLALEEGPQRLFFRKSYFTEITDALTIAKDMPIECIIGSNSKGDCARQIKPLATNPQPQQLLTTYETKIAALEEKLTGYKELLLSADKKLKEQALEIKTLQEKNSRETESLKKLHREEMEVLKTKFKAELQALNKNKLKTDIAPPQEAKKQQEPPQNKQQPIPLQETPPEVKTETPAVLEKKIQLSKNKIKEPELVPLKQQPENEEVTPALPIMPPDTQKKVQKQAAPTNEVKPDKKKQKEKAKDSKPLPVLENALKKEIGQLEMKETVNKVLPVVLPAENKKEVAKPVKKQLADKTPQQKQPDKTVKKKEVQAAVKETPSRENHLLPALPEEFDTPDKILNWWSKLEMNWQKAINVLLGNKEITQKPGDKALAKFLRLTHIDLANTGGNRFSFKLNNFSGVKNFSHIKYLNISGHQFKNLNGSQKLVALENFDCSNNQIETLSGIAKFTNLHTLNCANNLLKAGNFKNLAVKLPALRYIDCRGNSFTPADYKVFEALQIDQLFYR